MGMKEGGGGDVGYGYKCLIARLWRWPRPGVVQLRKSCSTVQVDWKEKGGCRRIGELI